MRSQGHFLLEWCTGITSLIDFCTCSIQKSILSIDYQYYPAIWSCELCAKAEHDAYHIESQNDTRENFLWGNEELKKYHMVSPGYSFTQDSVLRCAYLFYRVDLYSTKSETPPFSKNFGGVATKKDRGNMICETKHLCFTHSPFHG